VLQRLQEIGRVTQGVLQRYGGALDQFLVDDKGTTLLLAWGLPALARTMRVRAVRAALRTARATRLTGAGRGDRCGTGRAFGNLGNRTRCAYAVIGDSVNLAARLMQVAGASGGLLCDESTYQIARAALPFVVLDPLAVKGRAERVPVFAPGHAALLRETRAPYRSAASMVGRAGERARFAEQLRALAAGSPATTLVEGEPASANRA
jgi:class 3 adenylate cyclase